MRALASRLAGRFSGEGRSGADGPGATFLGRLDPEDELVFSIMRAHGIRRLLLSRFEFQRVQSGYLVALKTAMIATRAEPGKVGQALMSCCKSGHVETAPDCAALAAAAVPKKASEMDATSCWGNGLS
jgi:hypothetical protein